MPTMDTDTDIMARGLLMPSQLLLLSPLLMLTMVMDMPLDMPNMDMDMPSVMDMDMDMVMDMDMPTMDTTARGPLMLSPLLMLIMDTALMDMAMDMVMDTDMPTTVIPDTLMPTVPMDMDIIIKLLLYFVKN